ncbi:MAG: hypothetical protein CfP315_0289 [Candidatus Improbicoccus pseudotrichonymphae]|uniref:Uncharacterized protein n=1 Tax=Candidatus Improbicoccus pseudotrichonymphae TaxID=3033792 RepID=A0AA48I7Z8_9FIRM|nr:MAG: hypothetical protein CfP315_0289 [Candidatus Improbicoccus pseudotrichonymphae]
MVNIFDVLSGITQWMRGGEESITGNIRDAILNWEKNLKPKNIINYKSIDGILDISKAAIKVNKNYNIDSKSKKEIEKKLKEINANAKKIKNIIDFLSTKQSEKRGFFKKIYYNLTHENDEREEYKLSKSFLLIDELEEFKQVICDSKELMNKETMNQVNKIYEKISSEYEKLKINDFLTLLKTIHSFKNISIKFNKLEEKILKFIDEKEKEMKKKNEEEKKEAENNLNELKKIVLKKEEEKTQKLKNLDEKTVRMIEEKESIIKKFEEKAKLFTKENNKEKGKWMLDLIEKEGSLSCKNKVAGSRLVSWFGVESNDSWIESFGISEVKKIGDFSDLFNDKTDLIFLHKEISNIIENGKCSDISKVNGKLLKELSPDVDIKDLETYREKWLLEKIIKGSNGFFYAFGNLVPGFIKSLFSFATDDYVSYFEFEKIKKLDELEDNIVKVETEQEIYIKEQKEKLKKETPLSNLVKIGNFATEFDDFKKAVEKLKRTEEEKIEKNSKKLKEILDKKIFPKLNNYIISKEKDVFSVNNPEKILNIIEQKIYFVKNNSGKKEKKVEFAKKYLKERCNTVKKKTEVLKACLERLNFKNHESSQALSEKESSLSIILNYFIMIVKKVAALTKESLDELIKYEKIEKKGTGVLYKVIIDKEFVGKDNIEK